jgi:hypothetical protein
VTSVAFQTRNFFLTFSAEFSFIFFAAGLSAFFRHPRADFSFSWIEFPLFSGLFAIFKSQTEGEVNEIIIEIYEIQVQVAKKLVPPHVGGKKVFVEIGKSF